jgi:hypothetical protein
MRSSALLLMALAGAPLQAATLGDVAKVLTHRQADTYNNWDALLAITGAKWHDKDVPGAAFAWEGNVTFADLGPATVLVVGARQMMFDAEVSIGRMLEKTDLLRTLASQFPPGTLIEPVRGGCTREGATGGSRTYRVTLPGKQPLYLYVELRPGNGVAQSSTSFSLARRNKAQWSC